MIATLTGRLRRKLEDRIILECGGIGYEVFLPPIAFRQTEHVTAGRREASWSWSSTTTRPAISRGRC
jgi:Holliday junction resolvasome RuvABC DNA-binding subunit